MRGYIYRIVRDRGFGFIRGEDEQTRFFHCKDLCGDFDLLKEQDQVEFTSVKKGDKFRAIESKKGVVGLRHDHITNSKIHVGDIVIPDYMYNAYKRRCHESIYNRFVSTSTRYAFTCLRATPMQRGRRRR